MTISNKLSIKKVSGKDNSYHYDCIGSIDANSAEVLDTLNSVPAEASVVLDFSQIERVNSMGLSLLLKLFEEWESKKISIEVRHLNRMVNMLFKITGLGRFLKTDGKNPTDTDKLVTPEAPKQANQNQADNTALKNQPGANDKYHFTASLQSGQQLTGWYLVNTYLQRRLQKAIHFEQSQDVSNASATDLLFAKPFEACAMIKNHGFIPVMRPKADADEVVILVRADDERNLEDFQGVNVGTATKDSFVYLLGRFLCDESGLDSARFNFNFAGNEIKALQMLIRKKSEMIFMLKKTYEGLSSFSRNNVRKLDESETDFACHLFCVAPYLKNEGDKLSKVLQDMETDKQGQPILKDIQIDGWCKPEQGELQMLLMVYDRYVNAVNSEKKSFKPKEIKPLDKPKVLEVS